MDIISAAEKRYAVKSFNPELRITDDLMKKVEKLLQLSPSSINIQPWHYIIAESDEGKEKIAESAAGVYSYNKPKILNASHVIVFCAKSSIDDNYIDALLDSEDKNGRFKDKTAKENQRAVKEGFVNLHRHDLKDPDIWMKNQTYLSAGFFLLGISALGLDACPMEGFDSNILDKVLRLSDKGYTSSLIVAAGYRNSDDFNYRLPKSRLPEDSVIERI